MPTYETLTYDSPDGAQLGAASSDKIAFWGATPITQPTLAAQAELSPASLVTSLAGFGFYNATIAACFVAQVLEVRRSLVLAGLWKGS